MSTVYLVRHAQAGTRDAYDALSDLGKRQARLLGEHFVAMGIQFAAAYTGAMLRQRQTAEEVSAAHREAKSSFPAPTIEPGWNEFDLAQVDREIAPQLCVDDAEFRREYEAMREQVRNSNGVHAARIHRKWLPCDTKLMDAWIAGRYAYSGESWNQFRDRVAACQFGIRDARHNIIVFTSAAPIAIWTGLSMEICDQRVMRLAGALYNASYTILRLREDQLRLFTFNAAPHLAAPGMCTHR